MLKSLMDVVIKKTPGGIPNFDRVLRNHFTENGNDDTLKGGLKSSWLWILKYFLTLQSIANKWVEEGRQRVKPRLEHF